MSGSGKAISDSVAAPSSGASVQVARRARAQLAATSAAAIRFASRSDPMSSAATGATIIGPASKLMSDQRIPPAVAPSPETVRHYLAADAQRELDALHAELDVRLLALETALAHPDPQTSLGDLVLDLARVATAEAESSAARASLAAQLDAQVRAAAAASKTQRSLEAERATIKALRLELEQTRTARDAERDGAVRLAQEADRLRTSLEQERAAAVKAVRELDGARTALKGALDAGVAHRGQVAELEGALQNERDRSSALVSSLGRERDAVARASQAHAALQRDLAALQHTLDTHAANDADHRAALDILEQRCGELDRQCSTAVEGASEAVRERDALAAALKAAQQEAVAAQAAIDMRAAAADAQRVTAERNWRNAEARAEAARAERDALAAALKSAQQEAVAAQAAIDMQATAADAERATAERNWRDAEARAEEASTERDKLLALLEAAKKSVQGMQAAVDDRLATIESKRLSKVKAWEEAEARAQAAGREREALAAELDAVRQTTSEAHTEIARRLALANEEIRVLKLQLLESEGGRDQDVDLGSALDSAASPPSDQAGQRARRYAFPAKTKVHLGHEAGVLVDLSVTGAQVILATSPEVGRIVTLTMLSDETPCFCQGRLLWARREKPKGRPLQYRVGLVFTAGDEAAIHAFINRHSVS